MYPKYLLITMYITKTKTYSTLSISEVKENLRIHSTDSSYDSELQRLLKSAIGIAEKKISGDIVPTVNTLEDYCVYGCYYQINEPSISVSAITATNLATGAQAQITDYIVYKFSSYTVLRFNTSISADVLTIVYRSGFSTIPDDLRTAIKLKIGELFDIEKNGYVSTNLRESKAFDRIISPYMNLVG
jgi:hypothetical protein